MPFLSSSSDEKHPVTRFGPMADRGLAGVVVWPHDRNSGNVFCLITPAPLSIDIESISMIRRQTPSTSRGGQQASIPRTRRRDDEPGHRGQQFRDERYSARARWDVHNASYHASGFPGIDRGVLGRRNREQDAGWDRHELESRG